jgi:hypothetical protein
MEPNSPDGKDEERTPGPFTLPAVQGSSMVPGRSDKSLHPKAVRLTCKLARYCSWVGRDTLVEEFGNCEMVAVPDTELRRE